MRAIITGTFTRGVIVGSVAALVIGVMAGSAIAYLRGGVGDCGGTAVNFYFAGTGWTSDRRSNVKTGFNRWENVVSPTGGRLATVKEMRTGSGYEVAVRFRDTNFAGYFSCSNKEIVFNNAYRNNMAALKGIAAHEMGHAIGLGHADKNDSSDVPTMASCVTTTQGKNQATLEPDDHDALLQRRASVNSMHANSGFEDGTKFWDKTSTTYWESLTDNPAPPIGVRALRFRRSSGAPDHDRGVVDQSVRVIKPGRFDAAFYVRKNSGSVRGKVILSLPWRAIAYRSDPDCRGVIRQSDWMAGPRAEVNPSTSYQLFTTSTVNPDCGTHIRCENGVIGAQMTVRVRNALYQSGGDPPPAFVDEVRARAR